MVVWSALINRSEVQLSKGSVLFKSVLRHTTWCPWRVDVRKSCMKQLWHFTLCCPTHTATTLRPLHTHCMQTVLHLLVTVWKIPDPGSGCSWTMLESCKKCSQTDIALAAVLHTAATGINSIIANAHRTWCKHYVHVPHLLVSCTHIYDINSITCQCWRAQRLFAILNAFGMHAYCAHPAPVIDAVIVSMFRAYGVGMLV